jgi:hypothetical protein
MALGQRLFEDTPEKKKKDYGEMFFKRFLSEKTEREMKERKKEREKERKKK